MKKTVIITGAAGGIGKALCRRFIRKGYRVIASDIRTSSDVQCDEFVEFDLESIVHSDIAKHDFVQSVRIKMGDDCLHVLINNAAIQILGRTSQVLQSDWQKTLNINLTAPFLLIQSLLPQLEKAQGCVVNISSVHAQVTKPNFVSYATSKAALNGLTQSLAVDLGPKIRINAINPAATATEMLLVGFENNQDAYNELNQMHPIGRIADPDEVANVAVFLASDEASFLTGTCINVDGGISVRLHDPE